MDQQKSKDLQEVDIEILFWRPVGKKDTGHVALHVVKPELYISYWPAVDDPMLSSVPSKTMSYEDDLAETGMGRNPSSVLKLRIGLDMKAVLESWEDTQKKNYRFIDSNCSTAVRDALWAGNDDFDVSRYRPDGTMKDELFEGPYAREIEEIYDKLGTFRGEALANGTGKK